MKSLRKISKAWYLGAFVLVLDMLTKLLVVQNISPMRYYDLWYPYGGVAVFEDFFGIQFALNYATNQGAAWGVLADYKIPLLIARIALVVGMLVYLCFYNKKKTWNFPFALILGGAIGNIVDIFLYGHVVDMFHFVFWGYSYPVFNVADSCIFIGIAWLMIISSRKKARR